MVRTLERHGVRHVFGIPGDHTLPIYAALGESTINHCTTRHEQGAGFMADGYARASGEPGVAIVIGGPGVTNIATAMGEAYTDGVPLLVISAEVPTTDIGAGRDHNHEMKDQHAAASAICAYSECIRCLEQIPEAIDRAFERFSIGRPQSIHLGIPIDILADYGPISIGERPTYRPIAPDSASLIHAAELLRSAQRPIILLGGGARSAQNISPTLAEALGIPVMTTWNGKDAFPNDHPLYVGGGFHLNATLEALADADVVLAVGTQLGRSDFWHAPVALNGAIIRVDIDPGQIHANMPATIGIIADARISIEALADTVGKLERPRAKDRALGLRSQIDAEVNRANSRYKPWLYAVRAGLPANGIVAIDSTLVAYCGFRYLDIPADGTWLYPSAYGTLGYALTAVERGLGLPIIVWNDRGFGTIRQGMEQRGIKPLGVDFAIPDLAALARGFGCAYASPETPTELEMAIRDTLVQSVPTVIEVDDRLAS